MTAIESQLIQPIEFLQKIVSKGGPEPHEYDLLTLIADRLGEEHLVGNISAIDLKLLQQGFGDECLRATLHGHSITKPYGYAGDFMIIDKIYREYTTPDKRFEKWDRFWQNSAATQAVRNRKAYFIKTITNRLEGKGKLDLLNVASGPARDLADLYACAGKGQVSTVCIEADSRAIAYAKELTSPFSEQIEFVEKNIFRYEADSTFDVVWSAGLFDYFDDRVFVKILRKFVRWANRGGEVIIGNFSIHNPTRAFMELFGDWYLHHRSAEHLTNLAVQAGVEKTNIAIEREPEGVNLFLHIHIG